MRLLVIEDHTALRDLLCDSFLSYGFAVDAAGTAKEALSMVALTNYDLIILDLGLPDLDGITLLKQFRLELKYKNPCLILSARDALQSRIDGLDAGADDYLVKPFDMSELQARLRALLRRPRDFSDGMVQVANLAISSVHNQVFINGEAIKLARREYLLLAELASQVGWVIIKNQLEDRLYGFNEESSPNAVEAVVSRVRRKLLKFGAKCEIETVRGLGYKLTKQGKISC